MVFGRVPVYCWVTGSIIVFDCSILCAIERGSLPRLLNNAVILDGLGVSKGVFDIDCNVGAKGGVFFGVFGPPIAPSVSAAVSVACYLLSVLSPFTVERRY